MEKKIITIGELLEILGGYDPSFPVEITLEQRYLRLVKFSKTRSGPGIRKGVTTHVFAPPIVGRNRRNKRTGTVNTPVYRRQTNNLEK